MHLHTLIASFLFVLQAPAQDGLPNKHLPPTPDKAKVVAKVNGKAITAAQMEPYLWDWRAYEVVQDLISYEILSGEAAKQGVSVDEKELDEAFSERLKQVGAAAAKDQKSPEVYLQDMGFTKSRLYLRLKTDMLLAKLAEKGFKLENFVKISTIIARPASEQTSAVAEAIKKADDAYARLQKGEAWEKVLASVQPEPNIVQSKGVVGWRSLEAFPPSVQAEIRTLGVGKFTRPAQTANGIQIFRIDALGKEAAGDELSSLRQLYMENARRQIMDRLRTESKIEKFLGPPGS